MSRLIVAHSLTKKHFVHNFYVWFVKTMGRLRAPESHVGMLRFNQLCFKMLQAVGLLKVNHAMMQLATSTT